MWLEYWQSHVDQGCKVIYLSEKEEMGRWFQAKRQTNIKAQICGKDIAFSEKWQGVEEGVGPGARMWQPLHARQSTFDFNLSLYLHNTWNF